MELILTIVIFLIVITILWADAKRLIKFAVIIFIFYMLYQLTMNMVG